MQNILRVTDHVRNQLAARGVRDLTRRSLTVIPTRTGKSFYADEQGHIWRTFVFVEGARSYPAVAKPAQAYQAGLAFGEFQSLLVGLPGPRLVETIPHFHDTRRRFTAFQRAVRADRCNRAARVHREIAFAEQRAALVGVIVDALAQGRIPERITHNDTKFSNVLLDDRTGRAICVVDLDTVMPGCALYDFGDLVRSTTSPTLEDERDLAKVGLRMPLFKALARGYLAHAGGFLTKREQSLIAFSGKLISLETGLRFLTDYLSGDVYFRTHRAGQNLDRCRTQFALVASLERHEPAMQKFVDGL
jgi:aminoglycoside phosphotransferase (APT) family kinase protein